MRKFGLVCSVVLACIWNVTAQAAPVYFTDKTSFGSATASTVVEDFLGFPTGGDFGNGFTSNGITFSRLTGTVVTQKLLVVVNNPFFGPGTVSHVLTDNRNDDFRMDFGAPSHAVGFDTYLNNVDGSGSVAPPEAVIEIFDTSNGLIDTYTLTHNHTVVGFFGVVADQAIGAIRWTTTGGEFMNTGVTNIQQGMPIPAPGAAAILALGLLGVSFSLRKRR